MTREGSLHGESARALARVTQAVEYARYAPASVDWARRPGSDPRNDVRTVRTALTAATSRRRRVRAALVPGSSLRVLGRVGERIVEGLDTLEEAVSRVRARLLSLRR
jgi:hypothetical protein